MPFRLKTVKLDRSAGPFRRDDKVIFENPLILLRSRVSCSRHELGLKGMGRYVPRSGWAEQKPSRESCCGKIAIHHTCQPEFRRAKNCSFALRRLEQNREAKRVRRSLPVSRRFGNYSVLATGIRICSHFNGRCSLTPSQRAQRQRSTGSALLSSITVSLAESFR
jgi:hypothetical protein